MCDSDDTHHRPLAVQRQMCQFCPFRLLPEPTWIERFFVRAIVTKVRWICHKSEHAVCRGHYNQNRVSYAPFKKVFVDDNASKRHNFKRGDTVKITIDVDGKSYSEEIRW